MKESGLKNKIGKLYFRPKKIRFFLGFTDICGVYRSYEHALHQAGASAYFLNLGNELRERPSSSDFLIPRIFRQYYQKIQMATEQTGKSAPKFQLLVYKILLLALVFWIAFKFDVVMIKSAGNLSEKRWEIRILKRLGKTIIFTFHGSDSRPFYLNSFRHPDRIQQSLADLARLKEYLAISAELADYIIDSPTSAHLHVKQCCLRQVIFNPAPVSAFANKKLACKENRRLKLLHLPSAPKLKGTDLIRKAISSLKEKGYEFDYTELTNVPNEVVIDELLATDIVVDELYSDNYAGIFALEGLMAKKVVVVCGYALDHLNRFVPEWARAPSAYGNPDDLVTILEKLLNDSAARESYRLRAQNYINEIANPTKAAERLIALASGQAPETWFFDPADIRYSGGATAPLAKVHAGIREIHAQFGSDVFMLNDKPKLKEFILKEAGVQQPK